MFFDMDNDGETVGVYLVLGTLVFALFVGMIGRVMGLTDPSAPTMPCCVDDSEASDDEEAQREKRISYERESKRKRELDDYERKHKEAVLVKKGDVSKPPPRPKAATMESPNGKVLKKARLPAGSSAGARPSSRKYLEEKNSQGLPSQRGPSSLGRSQQAQGSRNSQRTSGIPGSTSTSTQQMPDYTITTGPKGTTF
jgi:hypothetical protein